MDNQRLARVVSFVLGMHVLAPLLLIVALLRTGLTNKQIIFLFPGLFFLNVVVPIGYIFIAQKLGKVSDWDLPKREERYTFGLVVLVSTLVSAAIVYFFGNKLLFSINIMLILLTAIVLTITRFWKISLHASMNTAAAIVTNFLFGWHLSFLYLLIPVVLWSRHTLGRHDLKQLFAGVALSVTFILGAFKYLGYI